MKNSLKKLSALGVTLTAGTLLATGAHAVCTQNAQIVERVISYGTYGYVYFRPEASLTNSTYYYVRTTSDQILSLAGDAQTNRSRVDASGDAVSCPTVGTGRYMGNARYLYITN